MRKTIKPIVTAAIVLPLAAISTMSQGQELRIGFIASLSGGAAILGKTMLNGFRLGMEHEGWVKDGDKFGTVPTKLIVADAQRKPDVALRAARRLIQSDNVQVISGTFFSNVAMAIYPTVIRARRVYLSTNAAPSPVAGRRCSPYFTAASFQNDQWGETLGMRMTAEGIKRVFILAPNYQAGKDMIAGFRRYFKGGKEIGIILFKLGQRDFQADISRIAAANPEALFVFAPGGMGISFMKQWAASGAGKSIKVYTLGTVDGLTIKPIGAAAAGSRHTSDWGADLQNKTNQKFVKDYLAKYKLPPTFYAAQSYDAARLLAAAVKKIGGKVDNTRALSNALRHTPFPSVRGTLKFNVNGMPIQNWHRQNVVMVEGKAKLKTMGSLVNGLKDAYWKQCPKNRRQ